MSKLQDTIQQLEDIKDDAEQGMRKFAVHDDVNLFLTYICTQLAAHQQINLLKSKQTVGFVTLNVQIGKRKRTLKVSLVGENK